MSVKWKVFVSIIYFLFPNQKAKEETRKLEIKNKMKLKKKKLFHRFGFFICCKFHFTGVSCGQFSHKRSTERNTSFLKARKKCWRQKKKKTSKPRNHVIHFVGRRTLNPPSRRSSSLIKLALLVSERRRPFFFIFFFPPLPVSSFYTHERTWILSAQSSSLPYELKRVLNKTKKKNSYTTEIFYIK